MISAGRARFTAGWRIRRCVALCIATSSCTTQDVGVLQTGEFPEGGSSSGVVGSGGQAAALPIADAGIGPNGVSTANSGATNGGATNGGATNGGTGSEIAGATATAGSSASGADPSRARCDLAPISCNGAQAAGPAYRVLTPEEYEYSVLDLFGVSIDAVEPFPYATLNAPGAEPALSESGREVLDALAREIATIVKGDADAVLGCDAGETERDCVARFIEERGPFVYRGTLKGDERAELLSIYDAASAGSDDAIHAGFEAVLVALLTSPRFVILSAEGRGRQAVATTALPEPGGSLAALSGYELASRLSYWLWLSTPDEELLRLGASDELMQPEVLRKQAARMLDDPKATRAIDAFYDEQFRFPVLAARASADASLSLLTPELALAMQQETKLLARDLYLEERSFEALFTASHTYANETLRVVYGEEIDAELGDEHERVELHPGRRPGLFTRGAWLATNGQSGGLHAPARGNELMRQMCFDIGVVADHPVAISETEGTARQKLAAVIEGPACLACHGYVDPPGLAFEVFDEVGRYGETQAGVPIETAGELHASPDVTLPFDDVPDLMRQLAQSPAAYSCLAERWLGRLGPWRATDCSVRQVARATCESGDLVQMLAELATTEAFRFVGPSDDSIDLEEGCETEGSHDCHYLAEHTGVGLAECQEFQGQACDPEAADGHPYFPCIGGITVIRGCCADDECNRAGAARFCGQGLAPHGVCVTTDAF